jgi:hypothetical protein
MELGVLVGMNDGLGDGKYWRGYIYHGIHMDLTLYILSL